MVFITKIDNDIIGYSYPSNTRDFPPLRNFKLMLA
jgi:hypothetical protein